ncbi:MAG: bifunctional adenosylcobinamide kinase/adenosylcobinamide-phosphate guanylyltransferase [Burkholderiaceae bacterium]|nr:bifunctional adenosylcobinamide kinase/adenosylcobinamide-phosphate guanylyltransferase [Burkholderiaceae bacterium]
MAVFARSELILGGQKSGKSRRAELLARDWLLQSPQHKAILIATAQPWDEEMRQRIMRHRQDRAERVPGLSTVEEPLLLAQTISRLSQPETLLVVDCLTLWLTNLLMPADAQNNESNTGVAGDLINYVATLLVAIDEAAGPVVVVSNEIGLGVIPMGREVRAFVDALGRLNQDVAQVCGKVTLMAAGLPVSLK